MGSHLGPVGFPTYAGLCRGLWHGSLKDRVPELQLPENGMQIPKIATPTLLEYEYSL